MDLCDKLVFNVLHRTANDYLTLGPTQLTISIKNLQYPIFEENFKWNQEGFLGAFGGIIGFFLGLDFFKIAIYTYSLLLIMYKKCRQKKNGRTENQNSADGENDRDVTKGQLATTLNEKLKSENKGLTLTRLTKRAKRWHWKHASLHTMQSTRSRKIQWLVSNLFKVIMKMRILGQIVRAQHFMIQYRMNIS